MKMSDQGEMDDKIIAVHANDPEYAHYGSISELPPHRMAEVKRFFEDYKALRTQDCGCRRIFRPNSCHKKFRGGNPTL